MARQLKPLPYTEEELFALAEITAGDEALAIEQVERDGRGRKLALLLAALLLGRALRPGETQPRFRYDQTAGRYVTADGRVVSDSTVRAELDAVLTAVSRRMKVLSESLRAGDIALGQWQAGMMLEVKYANLVSTAISRGGWEQMTPGIINAAEAGIGQEYQFLARFAGQIANGEQRLDGTVGNRASQYGQQGRNNFYANRQSIVRGLGYDEERSLLAPADNCDLCIEQEALSWQPIGQMIPIGERTCRGNCLCSVEYRKSDNRETDFSP